MNRKLPLLVLLLLLVAFPVHAGSIQEFSFTSLDDKIFTSTKLKGTPLVVNIGSHW